MVYVRDRDGVPKAAGQRTRFEGVKVVGEVCDYHFNDFKWQAIGFLVRGARFGGRIAEQVFDFGFAPMPSHHRNEIRRAQPCGANSTNVRNPILCTI